MVFGSGDGELSGMAFLSTLRFVIPAAAMQAA
jgi:hypothetical protein